LYERVTARTVRLVGRRLVVAVALLALIPAAADGAAPVTPQKLYQRLLVTPFPDAQLPTDFSSAKVGRSKPSSHAEKYHVVGAVEVDFDGPDVVDGILYGLFPTAAAGSVAQATANLGRLASSYVVDAICRWSQSARTASKG
jgi:hypothetical protein